MPRCRAIMCPGRTTSPFPRFNPKYFALESRPLLDEPPCFFDANLAKTALTLAFQHFNPSLDALGPAPRLTSARTDDAIARPEPLVGARESMEIQPITRRRTPTPCQSRARSCAHTHHSLSFSHAPVLRRRLARMRASTPRTRRLGGRSFGHLAYQPPRPSPHTRSIAP